MAFKFKFESILNLKTRMEDMKKTELKIATDLLESEKDKLKNFMQDRERHYEILKEKQEVGIKPNEFIVFNNYIITMKKKIKKQKAVVLEASNKVAKIREELIKVSQEKKMFETLKEKKMEEYFKEYYKKEQETADNVISYRYGGGLESE